MDTAGGWGSLCHPSLTELCCPTDVWCPTGDDSTDGSAAAPDDEGKDEAKGEDLGESAGPRPRPPWPPVGGGRERLPP